LCVSIPIKEEHTMSPTEKYAMILAIGGVLVEKGIVTREEIESKKENIMKYLTGYNEIMLSENETPEIEMKKMGEVDEILRQMAKECCFNFDSSDQEINRKLRESIVKQRQEINEKQQKVA
jgi:hypothetical protein